MATLPSASTSLDQSGAAVGAPSVDIVCIMGTGSNGPIATVRNTTRVQDELDTFGATKKVDLIAHMIQRTKKPVLSLRLTTAAAGTIGNVDATGVTGTAVPSIATSGDGIQDDEDLGWEIITGGVLGTAGIEFRHTRDGGLTWSGKIRLGTALTYTPAGVGATYTFGTSTATLLAGDAFSAQAYAPTYDSTGLAAGFDALAAHSLKPRLVVLVGECTSASDVQACIDEIDAYETEQGRHSVVVTDLRDRYRDARMNGEPADVDVDGTAHTITRGTGSWVTDGFKVGMTVTIDGSADNDGEAGVLTDVSATVLTFAAGLTTEANLDGADITITASESASDWRAALEAIVGATPTTQKVDYRVLVCGGRAMRASPINGARKRRGFSWPLAVRCMEHDIHVSPAEVALGPLEGWVITDDFGTLQEHDERVDGGLLASRITCGRTWNDKPGVYVALPVTLDEDDRPLSRLPVVLVGQLACAVGNRTVTEFINGRVLKKPTGEMQETEARRLEDSIRTELEIAVLQSGREGPRASSVDSVAVARDVVLVPGAAVTWSADVVTLGYLEHIEGTVRVS